MLWPNATRVLKEIGALNGVLKKSGKSTRFDVRSASGRTLMEIVTGRTEVPALCTLRRDLLSALLSAVPANRIRLGRELAALHQDRRKVVLQFADGTASGYDAVIGADGIRSRVRTELFGAIDPFYRGYTIWRGVGRYRGSAIASGVNSETWGHGHRFGILHTGGDRFTWYATANVTGHDSAIGKAELLEIFADWHAPVPQLIESTPSEEILRNGAYDLPPLRRWTKGRVTLLGDAAHPCTPNLGQGACMAIEDAFTLAKCLGGGEPVEQALRKYEALRRARTRDIQRRSLLMGEIGQWENRAIVAGRQIVTSLLPARLFERNLDRVYAYQA